MTVDGGGDESGNAALQVQYYDSNFVYQSGICVSGELPVYGGFYASSDAYYFLSGQNNPNESDEVEVFRITKYDTSWNRIGSASLFGANTFAPFDFGSARFAEYGEYLFVRTCHSMYASDDGYHHQANVTIKINTSAMEVESCFAGVMNISIGYASHSFNQFIIVDEEGNAAALDHGDAYPRSACLGVYGSKADSLNPGSADYLNTDTISYYGDIGNNTTNASVGGLAYSRDHYLTAGNSNRQDADGDAVRNVYVSVTPRSNFPGTTELKWLSSYETGGSVSASTPHLVKLGEDSFLVLWEERKITDYGTEPGTTCRFVFMDGSGSLTNSGEFEGSLSDCVPCVKDGKSVWYVTESNETSFYVLGPAENPQMKVNPVSYSSTTDNPAVSFPDVRDQNAYYYAPVYWAVEKGITNGRNGYFQPDGTCTRAEAVTFLYRMAGSPAVTGTSEFADVQEKNAFFYKAVIWAVENNITNGAGTKNGKPVFNPYDTCSRKMIVAFIQRFAANVRKNYAASSGSGKPFPDVDEGAWFTEPIRWAADKGITVGRDGKFYPDESCTRGQIVSFLYRYSSI
ncbi:MAG: S-layer homology domain-containing protein [Lachnospiraceae bacterium]|nr:S-layer homology domain-containing protein [Lachnospiraceae bacterium]